MFLSLELDLRCCVNIQDEGYSYLENLECLEHLNFNRMKFQTLCKILQKNQQMRELHRKNLFKPKTCYNRVKFMSKLRSNKFNTPNSSFITRF